ncbi:unnamed protein product [Ectocarpus sp. CCAP 1310/34]|nr:unnamed protein product [Ectocarpus sp. CCAP 1310/34]
MAFSSEHGLPPGARPGDANHYEMTGQTSFEFFSSRQHPLALYWDKPEALERRSISAEEGMVAIALQNLGKEQMLSKPIDADYSGGGRCDSGAWPMAHLISTGGEGVPNLQHLGGRREPETFTAADRKDAHLLLRSTSWGSSGIGGPRVEQQDIKEMQDLESSMPTKPPFGFRDSDGRSSGRTNSRKARLLAASRNDVSSQPNWRTGDSSSLSRLLDNLSYKSSSGSGSSGGGGPGVAQGTTHAGGSSSNGTSGGGGGGRSASWERHPRFGAGGAAMTHDGITIDMNSSSSSGSSSSSSRIPHKPLRQQSFDPHCKIRDSFLADVCLMPDAKPQIPPPPAPGGLVKDWEAAAVTATTTGTTERSGTSSGGVPYGVQHNRYAHHPGVSLVPSCNGDQGYPPTDTRHQVAPPPTPRVYHERKSSFSLLASMIPDMSKVSGRPSLPMAAAWPGAAGGGGIVGRFSSPGASSSMMILEDQSEGETTWTREAALARYHRKRKRRPFVKAMRENDPNRKEQNKARERPREGGKFQKKGKDFVSVKELQRAGDNRSVSGELPPPPARESTPPPTNIRSLNGRPSQEGDTVGAPGGGSGGGSGGSLYVLTPDQAAKLGLRGGIAGS